MSLQIQDSHGFSDTDSKAVSVFAAGGGGVGAPPGYGLTDPSILQAHGPIYIGSDAQFTAANGVRSGTGTIADPYIISNWFIDGNLYASSQAMLWIEGTSSYVVIENVRISNLVGTNQWEAFQLGHWPATISTQHVTIRHNEVVNAQHAYGIAIREGSSDIHIEANYVQLEANFDWVYGIATDRGVHGITVYGNYVNAHTSGTFHTVGIHLSDYHVTDARRATGMAAIQNTVVNATAGGIISESSVGTIIGWNLVYMDYPGSKSVATDYPRGIETEWFSNGTAVVGNVVHTFHWGIQVGSDQGVIASNTISDVDYAVYVLDNAAWPGISTAAETIYDTTYSSVAITPIRLPTGFQGTVVDLGPGITKTDLTPVLFVTSPAATSATFDWSGTSLNLSAIVGGMVVFDTASAVDAQTLHASWTGTLTNLDATSLSATGVSFQLQSAAPVVFDGTGFTPSTTYNVTRTNTGGTSRILSAQSTPLGGLSFTIPSSTPSTYAVSPGSVNDITPPVTTYSASGTGGAGTWYTSSVTVTLSATDDSSGVAVIHFRTDGGSWQSYSGPFTFQADGSHAIDYYSTDYSGNNETLRSVTVRIDGTAPRDPAVGHREDRQRRAELVGPARRHPSGRRIVHLLGRCNRHVDGRDERGPIDPVPGGWGRVALLLDRVPGQRERDSHRRLLRDGRRGKCREHEELRGPDQRSVIRASCDGVERRGHRRPERLVHLLGERHPDGDESERHRDFHDVQHRRVRLDSIRADVHAHGRPAHARLPVLGYRRFCRTEGFHLD